MGSAINEEISKDRGKLAVIIHDTIFQTDRAIESLNGTYSNNWKGGYILFAGNKKRGYRLLVITVTVVCFPLLVKRLILLDSYFKINIKSFVALGRK